MAKLKLSEETDKDVLEQWHKDAKEVNTPADLAVFVGKLCNDYIHDHGTIVHARLAAMLAAQHVVDRSDQGGITGFQAGCLGWMLVKECLAYGQEGSMRLLQFNDMLYPQHDDRFASDLMKGTWQDLQERAAKLLAQQDAASAKVREHWQSIVDGKVPFGWTVRKE
jgi:hypothetical protein